MGADCPTRIDILRVLPGLGDMLCAVPALQAVRNRWPDAHVRLVTAPGHDWIAERFAELVDEVVALPDLPLLGPDPERADPAQALASLQALAAEPADVAIQCHGAGPISDVYAALLGADRTVGPPDDGSALHEAERVMRVVEHAGATRASGPLRLRFPVTPIDAARAQVHLAPTGPGPQRPLVVVHPGSSTPARRWPIDGFARVIDDLGDDVDIVVTGVAVERPLAAALSRRHRRVTDLTGATTLGTTAAILARSSVVLCNDTGVSHLASAVGARTVVLSTDGEPHRWRPLANGVSLPVNIDRVEAREVARARRSVEEALRCPSARPELTSSIAGGPAA